MTKIKIYILTISTYVLFVLLFFQFGCNESKQEEVNKILPGSVIYDVTKPQDWNGNIQFAATPNDSSDDDSKGINEAIKAAVKRLNEKGVVIDPKDWSEYDFYTYQQIIYIPKGIYHLENPIIIPPISNYGNQGYIWLCGEGENQTIFKLKDANQIGVLGSNAEPVSLVEYAKYAKDDYPTVGNTNLQLFATNFSLFVPGDQPNIVGISYGSANMGAIRNVSIKAEENGGFIGLALAQWNNGPGWIENINIEGFDTGIEIHDGWGEGYAFSNIEVFNQNENGIGIYVADKQIGIENLKMHQKNNTVTPVLLTDNNARNHPYAGGFPHLTLLNSIIGSNQSNKSAIKIEKGHIFLRNIEIQGYENLIDDHGKLRKFNNQKKIDEYVSVHGSTDKENDNVIYTWGGAPESSINLPIKPTPEIKPEVFSLLAQGNYLMLNEEHLNKGNNKFNKDWILIDPATMDDDTQLFQFALNSDAKYIGVLNTEPLKISKTLIINGNSNKEKNTELIYGNMSEIYVKSELGVRKSINRKNEDPLFRIETGNSEKVIIKGFRVKADKNFLTDFTLFQDNSSIPLVIEDFRCKAAPRLYRNGVESYNKDLFVENVELSYNGVFQDTMFFSKYQNVWARQFNIEGPINSYPDSVEFKGEKLPRYSIQPKVLNMGGNFWVFSSKLGEQNGIFFETDSGGKSELFSIFLNPARTNNFVVEPVGTNLKVVGKDSWLTFVGQERIRTNFDSEGNATKELPHKNKFAVILNSNGTKQVIKGTSLPTYLRYSEYDPFQDSSYTVYNLKNHNRVAGLLSLKSK